MQLITLAENCSVVCSSAFLITSCHIIVPFFAKLGNSFVLAADSLSWMRDYPPGLLGKLIRPFATWLMKQTLLGNPLIRPWQYHAALVDDFQMEDFRFSSYYICCGTKPGRSLTNPDLSRTSGRAHTHPRSLSHRSGRRPDKLKTAMSKRKQYHG